MSVASADCGRLTMKIGRARQKIIACWPGASLLTSKSTGPPEAMVEASGFIWATNGISAAAAPTPAKPAVAM